MVSNIWSILVCALCVILLPAVCAEFCSSYWHSDGYLHDTKLCANQYCCGSCNRKYCCSEKKYRISQEEQEHCTGGPRHEKKVNIALVLGSIFGVIIPLLFCVCLVICCVAPCCLFYKKCRKERNRRTRAVAATTTAVNAPLQPLSPSGYQPSYPVYQPVPVQPGYGGSPNPTAPPRSYMEATDPAQSPTAPGSGQPMELYPTQPYAPTPYSDEFAQPPYNPSYSLNRAA